MKALGKLPMNSHYEKNGLRHRLKDFSILGLSTLAAAVVSTIVMDLLICPLSVFALKRTELFTQIFKYGFILIVSAVLVFMIIKKIHRHKKNGLQNKETFVEILKAPAAALASVFFLLIISAVIIAAIYILLSYNNRFINSLIKS